MNHITTAFAIAVLGYVGYIAVAPTPIATLDRFCAPVFLWPSRALAAGARLAAPETRDGIRQSFAVGFGRCRAWVWDVFYEDEYQAMQRRDEGKTRARAAAGGR